MRIPKRVKINKKNLKAEVRSLVANMQSRYKRVTAQADAEQKKKEVDTRPDSK